MAERHFDLNKALSDAEAKAAGNDDETWLTFDAGDGFMPPWPATHMVTDPETGEEHEEPYNGPAPERKPWRVNRLLAGWQVMRYMDAQTIGDSLRAGKALIQASFDPEQWEQFEAFLVSRKVPLEVIDYLINQIVKDQVGLPLDR